MQSDIPRPKTGEIKLFENSKERDLVQSLAEFYSIIKTTDLLEQQYSNDAIKDTDGTIQSVEDFFQQYQIDCPRAYERLVVSGVPATVLHSNADSRAESVLVAETVQAFITAMDAVKLGQRAIDELHPLLSDLSSSLTKLHFLPADFEGSVKTKGWLAKLNSLRAVDELSEDDIRQLLFDLETNYSAFHKLLGMRK
eukprot:gene40539-49415_t